MYSIKSGGTVVEGTAGNTGIGLAHVCRAKGYKCVIFMPDTQVKNNHVATVFLANAIVLRAKRRLTFSECSVLKCIRSPRSPTRIRSTITTRRRSTPRSLRTPYGQTSLTIPPIRMRIIFLLGLKFGNRPRVILTVSFVEPVLVVPWLVLESI
jgi:hypothetical protein